MAHAFGAPVVGAFCKNQLKQPLDDITTIDSSSPNMDRPRLEPETALMEEEKCYVPVGENIALPGEPIAGIRL